MEALKYLAWPVTVLIILLIFCRPLYRLLDRIRYLRLGEARIGTRAPQEKGPGGAPDPTKQRPPLPEQEAGPLLSFVRNAIRESLEARGLSTEADRVRALVDDVAVWSLSARCERIYGLIFGSQIDALQLLNSPNLVSAEIIRPYYNTAAASAPALYAAYPFEQWLAFLSSWGLVEMQGQGLRTSEFGRLFLHYLIEQGMPTYKSL
ncbi:MAG: hypothetical protein HZC42_13305 [Candidatus Eisenbacteria bacterium]|nr:hypothetical protein [Candidatus Eisenbacteria bacterium]